MANLVQYGNVVNINNIINTNIFESIKKSNLFSIIFFSVMFELGVDAIWEKGKPVLLIYQGYLMQCF